MDIKKLGRYEILSQLGQGAMGVVYLALDPLLDRTVAVKTVNLDFSPQELAQFESRFYREAQSAGRLNHPNIITIHDMGKTDNIAYMAMELLDGQELRDLLGAGVHLPIKTVVDIAIQVAEGLAYAHDHDVIHRDIKPSNIMIIRDNQAKIMDFGIAQISSASRTMTGTVVGSPKYMSPEQVAGTPIDGRSDIFSLGVVLYEMLTGENPFSGDNIYTIMYRIMHETPRAPSEINPAIPPIFDEIIQKALAKDLNQRYANAKQLAMDLRNHEDPLLVIALAQPHTTEEHHPARTSLEDTLVIKSKLPSYIRPSADEHMPVPIIGATLHNVPSPNNKKLYLMLAFLIVITAALIFASYPLRSSESSVIITEQVPQDKQGIVRQPLQASVDVQEKRFSTLQLTLPKQEKIDLEEIEPIKSPNETKKSAQKIKHESPQMRTVSVEEERKPKEPSGAKLELNILPWGEIYVDGERLGVSPPLKKIHLAAGEHTIEIRNGEFTPYRQIITAASGGTPKIKHHFR